MRTSVRTTALAGAALASIAAVAAASSCSSTPTPQQAGDFIAPSGLTVTSAADRDVLFVASAGGDELRALNICNKPTLADGGQDPTDTCPAREDFQFVPGPIRVFPASLAVGDRPVRLASARLIAPDGGSTGAVLVGGADTKLKVIDAANVIDAAKGVAPLHLPGTVDLVSSPPVDVIAINAYAPAQPDVEIGSSTVRGFALTQGAQGAPANLVALSISAGATGPQVVKVGRCVLPQFPGQNNVLRDVLPTRLAVIPRSGVLPPGGTAATDAPYDNLLYIADGTPNGVPGGVGDGALELDMTQPLLQLGKDPLDTPGTAVQTCAVIRRISATITDPVDGGPTPQPLNSLALSPRFFAPPVSLADGGTTARRDYPPGALLLGVTASGRLAFVDTAGDGGMAPLPPVVFQPGDTTSPRMEDLSPNGLARDVGFLKPPTKCPANADPALPCTLVQTGNTAVGALRSVQFPLVAVATSTDGATYFLDADKRRFLNDLRDVFTANGATGPEPSFTGPYVFGPSQPVGHDNPVLTFPQPEVDPLGNQIPGGICCTVASSSSSIAGGQLNAGVTRRALWRIIWHGIIPGLERRSGTLTRGASGALHLAFPQGDPAASLTTWQTAGLLDKGDVFIAQTFSKPDGSALCDVLTAENAILDPTVKHELTITGLAPNSLDATEPAGFHIDDACLPVGITVEVRAGAGFNNEAWLVLEGPEVRGRAANGVTFRAREPRFDYPLEYATTDPRHNNVPTTAFYPTPDKDIGVAFTIGGPDPVIPQSLFTFTLDPGQALTHVADLGNGVQQPFAGPLIVYSSPKVTNLVFNSVIGGNSVVQSDPAALQVLNGVLVYR